jgi:hypothetical protein
MIFFLRIFYSFHVRMFNKREKNGYKGMFITFDSLLNFPMQSGRNIHSFNEREVKY